MSRILKSSHYCDTETVAMGVRVLRSAAKHNGAVGSFRTPPGLTLEEWKDRVAEIEASANEKASEILKRAEDRAREIEKSARDEGYANGYSSGYEEGMVKGRQEALDQCKQEWEHRLNHLATLIEEVSGFRSALIERYRTEIVELVMEVANIVICAETERNDQTVLRVIDSCLRKASSPSALKIKTNLADLAVVTEVKQSIASRFPGVQSIEVIDDPSVSRGGCLIETDNGFLDARIDHQLKRIREALESELEENGNE